MSLHWIWSDKITNEGVARVGYNHFIFNKGEWNNCFFYLLNSQTGFCCQFLFPQFYKALMSLFLNKTHQLRRNVYLTCRLLNKDIEQLKLALMGEHCLALG